MPNKELTAETIYVTLAKWKSDIDDAMMRVVEDYRAQRAQLDAGRKLDGIRGIPMPRVKVGTAIQQATTAAWNLYVPLRKGGAMSGRAFVTEYQKRRKRGAPYPMSKICEWGSDDDALLVLSTERRLRTLEGISRAVAGMAQELKKQENKTQQILEELQDGK